MRCWAPVYSGLTPRAANKETERGGIPPGTEHRCALSHADGGGAMRCWASVYSGLMPRAANKETERGGIPPGTEHRLRLTRRESAAH